jgi:hypothetical protein
LLDTALRLLRDLSESKLTQAAEHAAAVMLAADPAQAATARAAGYATPHGLRSLPPIPRIAPWLAPRALSVLWLCRIELCLSGQLRGGMALAAALQPATLQPVHGHHPQHVAELDRHTLHVRPAALQVLRLSGLLLVPSRRSQSLSKSHLRESFLSFSCAKQTFSSRHLLAHDMTIVCLICS